MCACKEPNINGTFGYSWDGRTTGKYPVNPPDIGQNDSLIFDEPGRCGGIDSHAHHYRVVFDGYTFYLVISGAETIRVRLANGKAVVAALQQLDSNGRYWLLNAISHTAIDYDFKGYETANKLWQRAAVEKRIRTRKIRNSDKVRVWVENSI